MIDDAFNGLMAQTYFTSPFFLLPRRNHPMEAEGCRMRNIHLKNRPFSGENFL
jgi:hypothetical protein